MTDTDAILAMIDGALADLTSSDAMRWTPDPKGASFTEVELAALPTLAERMLDAVSRLAEAERVGQVMRSSGPDHERLVGTAFEVGQPLTVADLRRAHNALAHAEWDRLDELLNVQPAAPPPAPTLEDLLNLGRWLIDLSRVASRLEVDRIAMQVIRDRVPPGHEPVTPWGRPLGGMFDLPVILDETLPPGGWRFLDADGGVIAAGMVRSRIVPWLMPPTIFEPGAAIRITGVT